MSSMASHDSNPKNHSSLGSHDSDSKNPSFYSRKDKSLGVLCTNFLKLYDRDGVDSIGLDNAAAQLGVERRRIYDIVNILESVGVLARKAKNQYSWKGFSAIPLALQQLKKDAGKENFHISHGSSIRTISSPPVSKKNEHGGSSRSNIGALTKASSSTKVEHRKEKSLGILTQNFIKLFLSSDADLISLDGAAAALLGDMQDPTAMRTKVRRLYDIANVFSSMDLIEKTRHPESGKPAFRWLGGKGSAISKLNSNIGSNTSKRRVFGTEIMNICAREQKADSLFDKNQQRKASDKKSVKENLLRDEGDENSMQLLQQQGSKDFVFGPFAPANLPTSEANGNKKVRRVRDWENVASTYRPQYRNQALSDLFAHYVDAWKTWCVEAAEKKHIQPVL